MSSAGGLIQVLDKLTVRYYCSLTSNACCCTGNEDGLSFENIKFTQIKCIRRHLKVDELIVVGSKMDV